MIRGIPTFKGFGWTTRMFSELVGSTALARALLPEIIFKEPLAPAVRQGDDSWEDLVRWTHEAMVAWRGGWQ